MQIVEIVARQHNVSVNSLKYYSALCRSKYALRQALYFSQTVYRYLPRERKEFFEMDKRAMEFQIKAYSEWLRSKADPQQLIDHEAIWKELHKCVDSPKIIYP